jgi:hypothetical protein
MISFNVFSVIEQRGPHFEERLVLLKKILE